MDKWRQCMWKDPCNSNFSSNKVQIWNGPIPSLGSGHHENVDFEMQFEFHLSLKLIRYTTFTPFASQTKP
jgi:hypothetical protein